MIRLIRAGSDDLPRLREFYKYVIDSTETMKAFCRWVYGLQPSDEMILRYIGEDAMYFAEENGRIISSAAALPYQEEDYHSIPWGAELSDGDVLSIHILGVAPEMTRRGIAGQMMEAFTALARDTGKKAVRLDTLETNKPAHILYDSIGFSCRGTHKGWAKNTGITNFIYYERLI